MGKLTALAVKAASKPGRYQDGRGLMLLVKSSGSRSWVLRVQVNGKRRDFGLGPLSEVRLAEAREKADIARRQIRDGLDPVEVKRAANAAARSIPSFQQAAELMHQEHEPSWRNVKHRAQWLSSLRMYAFPTLGDASVDQIDGPMIRDVLLPIWLEKPETARRVRQRVGAVLDWCYAKGLRASEAPLRSISKGLPRQPKRDNHFAAMPHDRVPSLLAMLAEADAVGRLALQFLILTACRSGEVRGAVWEEIDIEAGTWTIPAERMKAGKVHMVPLPGPALAILDKVKMFATGLPGGVVFPGAGGRMMSDMTLTKALRVAGGQGFTVHGFRSSFRDWAAEMTVVPGDVVEAALAHTITSRVEAAYRRTNYLDKRRELMDAWAQYLLATSQNVIPILRGIRRG